MTDSMSSALIAHLWQSTAVVGGVWLTTLALRAHRARVRYWLWTAASVKFLVPFSWLMSVGAQVEWRTAPAIAQPAAAFVIERVLAPPPVVAIASAAAAQPASMWPSVLPLAWAAGIVVVLLCWWRQWRLVRAALREAIAIQLGPTAEAANLRVLSSPWAFEPGVVGIWRPVLLLPEGLAARLTPAQLNAVIAHERCHIRHHDNLGAAVHMVIEALFWFHPLVWWIERRLVDERERACDEAVLCDGSDPADYAEGILTVCRLTLQAPLACVAGVTGSDLRRRIESILLGVVSRPTGVSLRCALALAAIASIALPVIVGAANAVPLIAIGQESSTPVAFSVASVKANKSGERPGLTNDSVPGVFTATNVWVGLLIRYAYEVQDNQIVDAPDWIRTLAPERFDVAARLEGAPAESRAMRLAMRTLLAERFKLAVRRETREVPMYALVMARRDGQPGPMLKPASSDCSPEAVAARAAARNAGTQPPTPPAFCGMRVNTGRIQVGGYSMADFAKQSTPYGRSVVDRTGLAGKWEFVLTFTPEQPGPQQPGQNAPVLDPNGPSLLTALQEQLGLKLEPIKGPMDVLVIEHIERPTEN